ncbi:MAG: hypothetical protein Q8P55_01935 [bacterium]|nr:hypothetical protein [bacterium]
MEKATTLTKTERYIKKKLGSRSLIKKSILQKREIDKNRHFSTMNDMAKKRKKGSTRLKKRVQKRKARNAESLEGARKTKVRVIGIGGGGGSIVGEIARTVGKADFVAINTDLQAQKTLPRSVKGFIFGQELTRGLGCGMDALLGEAAARAGKDRIKKLTEGQDVCILVASLGGGTGSGASSVVAEAAREAKCLTLGIFTLPFSFEGQKRRELADTALEKIIPLLNAYVIIPNENIFKVIDAKTPLKAAFSAVNKRLAETLEGFIDTLSLPGLINIDFADVKTLLEGRGRLAYLNSVAMQGDTKTQLLLKEVLNNPLYDYGIAGADRMMFNLTGDKAMKMQEVADISKSISSFNTKARIIFGISFQQKFRNKLRIALFAMGCKEKERGRDEKPSPVKLARKKTASKKPMVRLRPPVQTDEPQKKTTKKPVVKKIPPPAPKEQKKDPERQRRSAVEVKKAQDQELKDLEKRERQWDIPAFLRNTRREEQEGF